MAYGNQAQEYRRNAVLSASPAQLVVMLYDGALRFIEAGRAGMRARDLTRQNEQIQRAQKIVSELLSTLDREAGGEIAENLERLYHFVLDQLFKANLEDDERPLDAAAKTLRELREAWVQVASTAVARPATNREVALAA